MRRVINLYPAILDEYVKRFTVEHIVPIRESRLQLHHLNSEFPNFDGKIYKLIGVVDVNLYCVQEVATGDYYHVERWNFQQYILKGYINKNQVNEKAADI